MSKVHLNKHLSRSNQDLIKVAKEALTHVYVCNYEDSENKKQTIVYGIMGKSKDELLNERIRLKRGVYQESSIKWLKRGALKISIRDINVPMDSEDVYVYDFTINKYVRIDRHAYDENGNYDVEFDKVLHGTIDDMLNYEI